MDRGSERSCRLSATKIPKGKIVHLELGVFNDRIPSLRVLADKTLVNIRLVLAAEMGIEWIDNKTNLKINCSDRWARETYVVVSDKID